MNHFHYNFVNHLVPIRDWVAAQEGHVTIDGANFELTLSVGARRQTLIPRFLRYVDARTAAYVHQLVPTSRFVGWLPYAMRRWPAASSKKTFREFCEASGLRMPLAWAHPSACTTPFIVKPNQGSFGKGIEGPYRPGDHPEIAQDFDGHFEQYVEGVACKIWYLAEVPLAIARFAPSTIMGDGKRTIAQILSQPRGSFDQSYGSDLSAQFLKHQGHSSSSVPADGERVQLDFRFGHGPQMPSFDDQNSLARESGALRQQLEQIGEVLAQSIPEAERRLTAYTVDAVLDPQERVWLLEMNCHTVQHPAIYVPLLDRLFEKVTA